MQSLIGCDFDAFLQLPDLSKNGRIPTDPPSIHHKELRMKTADSLISSVCNSPLAIFPPSLVSKASLDMQSSSEPHLHDHSDLSFNMDEQTNSKSNLFIPGSPTTNVSDPTGQKLFWTKPPLSVLVIRSQYDSDVLEPFVEMVIWLVEAKELTVYIDHQDLTLLKTNTQFTKIKHRILSYKTGDTDLVHQVDFIICLGKNGLLSASSLFQVQVPPVLAFNVGSPEFLSPFQFDQDFRKNVSMALDGYPTILHHYRLKCVLVRKNDALPHVQEIQKENGLVKVHKLVLNEVVVKRGPASFLSNFELYIEGRLVTSVQGDGLVISTPTGSSAYAVAAGASMVHPSVPCILITPICPHSLSFRPIVVPAGVEIKVMLNPRARSKPTVSFDGIEGVEMSLDDSLLITTAKHPVPSICVQDQVQDWFECLSVCLNWNLRRVQKPMGTPSSYNPRMETFDPGTPAKPQDCPLKV